MIFSVYNEIMKNDRSVKLEEYSGTEKCEYGCGNVAKYRTKNKKLRCAKSHHSCEAIQKKKKKTFLDRYGSENPMQSPAIVAKTQNTMIKRYGKPVFSQTELWLEKCKQHYMETYGVDHMWKDSVTTEQRIQTLIDKYGVDNPMKSQEILAKREQKCLEKLGVKNPFQLEENKEKYKKSMMDRYGVTHNWSVGELRSKIVKSRDKSVSKIETAWLDSLGITSRQVVIKASKNYIVDGFDKQTNTVYEMLGVFWHGHPGLFDQNKQHPVIKNKTFGDLYTKCQEKILDLRNHNFTVIAIWENGESYD